MAGKIYIENMFLEFAHMVLNDVSLVDHRDMSAISSFYTLTAADRPLTKSQRDFMLKLLEKYAAVGHAQRQDYLSLIADAEWKHDCRVLDLSRQVSVEKSADQTAVVCVKFPYAFKSIYERGFLEPLQLSNHSQWDHERKINKIDLNKVNFVCLYEFLAQHQFEFDESVYPVLTEIEEIWAQQDSVSPSCCLLDHQVILKNAAEDAQSYWEANKINSKHHDLMLAKQMGFVLEKTSPKSDSIFEKICSSEETAFWCPVLDNFFTVHKAVQGITVIILDRSDDVIEWMTDFLACADANHIDRNDIKVCFRDDAQCDSGLNAWIKHNSVGGKISEGKIFLFRQKPAKWLFADHTHIKIAATNSLFPIMSAVTQKWLDSHYCLMYLGNIKAAHAKEKNIVQL